MSQTSSLTTKEQPAAGFFRYVDLVVTLLVIARCAWIFATPLRSADLPLRFAQDDFFYYLKPAQNLAWFHRSTFDGATLTNGYHPLYFVLLTVVSFFVRTVRGIFRFLWVLDTTSATVIFLCTRRIFARFGLPVLANALAVVMTILCVPLICDQMEVTLALPLGFAFLMAGFVAGAEITPRRAAGMGLLGALTFLARLDAGLLVVLYVAGALCLKEYRAAMTRQTVLSFLLACVPLPLLYFWLNLHYFGTLLPVSGMAKQLRHGHSLSLLLPASFNGTSELLLNVALATGVLGWALRRYLAGRDKLFLFVVLSISFLFYGLEMLISDWPIWNWYFYDLRFAAAGAALLFCVVVTHGVPEPGGLQVARLVRSRGVAVAAACGALLVLFVQHYKVDHWMVEIQHAAGVLDQFEMTHPGKYAMGDRAGMFAITHSSPVLQTEGLVMDRNYLEHIRAQDDLRSVLREYGVNYYVAFVFDHNMNWQVQGPCFHAMEPSIAGADALRMRSDFCEPPVFRFPGMDGEYLIYRVTPS